MNRRHPSQIRLLAQSAMLLALGLLLPFATGQIPRIGKLLLPMHLPVLLCGLLCGPVWGGLVGLILPPLRYLLFGMPPIYPTGLAMCFELAAYAVIAGAIFQKSRGTGPAAIYGALLPAMIGGRLIWGAATAVITGLAGQTFTLALFWAGAVANAVPGILLQLILVPALLIALDRTGLVTLPAGR